MNHLYPVLLTSARTEVGYRFGGKDAAERHHEQHLMMERKARANNEFIYGWQWVNATDKGTAERQMMAFTPDWNYRDGHLPTAVRSALLRKAKKAAEEGKLFFYSPWAVE